MYSIRRILKALYWLVFGKPDQRRRVRLELARMSASLFGDYYISEDYKLWREDTDFINRYNSLSPGNPYSQDRKYTLREFARQVRNVDGDMAECGCYEGATAWFMANEHPDVPLHLFDSFAGLSEPGRQDVDTSTAHFKWKTGDMSSPKSRLRETLKDFRRISIYQGWIPERFPEVADKVFRLVHIDVDLYQPTRDSLEFFYPRMAPGGVLVFDDYGVTTCPGAYKAVNEFMQDKPEYVLHLPSAQGIIIKS